MTHVAPQPDVLKVFDVDGNDTSGRLISAKRPGMAPLVLGALEVGQANEGSLALKASRGAARHLENFLAAAHNVKTNRLLSRSEAADMVKQHAVAHLAKIEAEVRPVSEWHSGLRLRTKLAGIGDPNDGGQMARLSWADRLDRMAPERREKILRMAESDPGQHQLTVSMATLLSRELTNVSAEQQDRLRVAGFKSDNPEAHAAMSAEHELGKIAQTVLAGVARHIGAEVGEPVVTGTAPTLAKFIGAPAAAWTPSERP